MRFSKVGLIPATLLVIACGTAVAVNIETVPVGNPRNANDTTGYGSVGYTYKIGKYEVTAGQYAAFLNAVAKADTHGLYNTTMWSSEFGCKISRSGVSGNYSYSVAANWANRPVNYVSFWDACRFSNWLDNGQPTGAQGADTTERGAYTLDGYNGSDGRTIQRNAGATWALPSENEWYKAAYHKNDGATGHYWDYPTGSDIIPSGALGNPDPGNNVTACYPDYTIGYPYYRTEVGAHENSESPYGTFDQGGNVDEWNETVLSEGSAVRGLSGAAFDNSTFHSAASFVSLMNPGTESYGFGFRVCEVPEPATVAMLALAGAGVLRRRKVS